MTLPILAAELSEQLVNRPLQDTVTINMSLAEEGRRLAEQMHDRALLQALADWRTSTGAAHVRDRRWAMALLAVERTRRDLRRAEVRAAVQRAEAKRRREAA